MTRTEGMSVGVIRVLCQSVGLGSVERANVVRSTLLHCWYLVGPQGKNSDFPLSRDICIYSFILHLADFRCNGKNVQILQCTIIWLQFEFSISSFCWEHAWDFSNVTHRLLTPIKEWPNLFSSGDTPPSIGDQARLSLRQEQRYPVNKSTADENPGRAFSKSNRKEARAGSVVVVAQYNLVCIQTGQVYSSTASQLE